MSAKWYKHLPADACSRFTKVLWRDSVPDGQSSFHVRLLSYEIEKQYGDAAFTWEHGSCVFKKPFNGTCQQEILVLVCSICGLLGLVPLCK